MAPDHGSGAAFHVDYAVTAETRTPTPVLPIREPMPAGRGRLSDLHTHPSSSHPKVTALTPTPKNTRVVKE